MKPTEMLSQIKTLLGAKLNLAQMTLQNGTIIEAEAFESGQAVFIVTEDERVALPVGEYALEDGKMLIVEEEGMIASIAEASVEAEEEEMQEEQLEEETVEVEAPEEVAEEVTAVVEAVVEAIAPVLEEVKQEVEELKKKFASYEDKKEKMASQEPARKPLKHNPEKNNKKAQSITFAENRNATMKDRVFNKLFN